MKGGDLMGAIGLLIRSLSVEETAGSLQHALLEKRCKDSKLWIAITQVAKVSGMEFTDHARVVIGKLCRSQQVSVVEDIHLKHVDRGALSGLNVLMGLLETFCDYDPEFLDKNTTDSILSFVRPLVGMEHSKALKRLKYVLSYWMAEFLNDEKPEKDDPTWDNYLFSGTVRQYLKLRIRSRKSAKNSRLFWSLFHCKGCCDVVPDSFIKATFEKHRKIIGTPSKEISDELRMDIEERTDEILKSFSRFEDKQCEPSHSACFERGRGLGGQHRELIHQIEDEDDQEGRDRFMQPVVHPWPDDLIAMIEIAPGLVEERRGWRVPSRRDVLRAAYEYERTQGRMTCGVEAVLEPIKVRTITKGRAQAYQAVHGVQKWMHKNLRKMKIFQLIGTTVTEDVIKSLLKTRLAGELLVSGDYSAATDNLKIAVTKTIFERILKRILNDLQFSQEAIELVTLARKVLYEHLVSYPKWTEIPDVEQATGQLMGSPLSFPILCLANLICYWVSVCPTKDLTELRVLVNGDDIAFPASREVYQTWSNHLSDFGFVKSVGKNYIHERFVIINSELFDSRWENTGVCHLPRFSAALLMGRSKVSKSDQDLEAPPVVVSLELVLRGATQPSLAFQRFLYWNGDKVREVTSNKLNLFLPRSQGGVGLNRYGATWGKRDQAGRLHMGFHISAWQRQYAAYLAQQPVLKVGCFVREADEAGRWKPLVRLLDEGGCDYLGSRNHGSDGVTIGYTTVPLLDDEDVPVPDESVHSNPLFSAGAVHECLNREFHRSKVYRDQISEEGPCGWRLLDVDGHTRWRSTVLETKARRVMRSLKMRVARMDVHKLENLGDVLTYKGTSGIDLSEDLTRELQCRYSTYVPHRPSGRVCSTLTLASVTEDWCRGC
jgi:hypothetical protein